MDWNEYTKNVAIEWFTDWGTSFQVGFVNGMTVVYDKETSERWPEGFNLDDDGIIHGPEGVKELDITGKEV